MGVFDDLDAFLIDNAVTATLSVGGSASVIFDTPFAASFNGLVGDSDPVCTGKTAALSAVTVGSTLTINATTYTVCAIEADGQGMTALRLK
jgi:alcohol dehydrogenase YqhD (iron-dependent ADH family)